jgi:hypothetical protein
MKSVMVSLWGKVEYDFDENRTSYRNAAAGTGTTFV